MLNFEISAYLWDSMVGAAATVHVCFCARYVHTVCSQCLKGALDLGICMYEYCDSVYDRLGTMGTVFTITAISLFILFISHRI